jgi:hypothetical protein
MFDVQNTPNKPLFHSDWPSAFTQFAGWTKCTFERGAICVLRDRDRDRDRESEKRETAARVRVRSSCEGRKLRLAAPSLPRVDRRRRGRDGGGSRGPGRRGHQLLPGARGAGQDRYAPVDLEGTWVSQRGLRVVRRGRGSGFRGSYIGRAW